MFINQQHLVVLALWATTVISQATPTQTVSATISDDTATPLSHCQSICKLMELTVPNESDPDMTLFLSLCKDTGRDHCEDVQQQFSVDFIPASGDSKNLECICKRNDPAPGVGEEVGESTTTSTTTVTSTIWVTSPSLPATATAPLVGETSINTESSSSSSPVASTQTPTPTPGAKTTLNTETSVPTVASTTPSDPTASRSSLMNTALPGLETTKSKPKARTIAGVVVGLLVLFAIIGGGAIFIRRRQIQKNLDKQFADNFAAGERPDYNSHHSDRSMI